MEEHFTIREAAESDAAALLDIYAPYIRDTAITFEYDVPTAEEFAARIADILKTHPYLVCERDGKPAGYAYAHRIRERAAYDWAAELSIYLAPEAQGQGVGTALYQCLTDLLVLQQMRVLYGCSRCRTRAAAAFMKSWAFRLWACGTDRAGSGTAGTMWAGLKSGSAHAAYRSRSPRLKSWTGKKYRHVYTDIRKS